LPHELNRIPITDFVSYSVIEEHAHEVPYFRAARLC
jgi:hypothetical protein